jgi:hypothetical protein
MQSFHVHKTIDRKTNKYGKFEFMIFHSVKMLFFVLFVPFISTQIIRDEIDYCFDKKCNETHSTCGFDDGKLNCVDYKKPGSTVLFITKKFRFPKCPTFVFITDGNMADFLEIEPITLFNPVFPSIRGHLYKMLFEETTYYLKLPGRESIQRK